MLFPTLRNPLPEGGGKLHQLFLVMRITTILLLAGSLQISAAGFAQKISISGKDIPLKVVFKTIEKQTGYVFAYDDEVLVEAKNISIHAVNLTVKEVLDECLRDQPLYYTIEDKTIFIKKKLPEKRADIPRAIASPFAVGGTVKTESGVPLAGASVTIKGSKKAGITDSKGEFVLQGVPNGKYTLQISFVGYEPFEMVINVTDNAVAINAILKQTLNILDEAQVIAYGEVSKRLQTGNVTTVKAEEIAKQPINNPLLALEGRVPGLVITQSVGLPGGGITVRIQGQNSINGGNDPFYVVDGVPYVSQLLPDLTGVLGTNGNTNVNTQTGYGNPLNFINPADIESIDVLKDADATAIYGSRAANGAILITTKKGKAGPSKVELNFQSGWGKVTRMLPLLNAQQYLIMRHEAFINDGITPGPFDYDINGAWDTTRYTDWQKVLIGGTARYTDGRASVSGGNGNTGFLLGAGYHKETTVFPGDLADSKGSLHFNVTHTSTNRKFNMQLSGNYMVDNNQLINSDFTYLAITLAPDAPPLYNADGILNWAPLSNGNSTWINPITSLYNKYSFKTNNLIGNVQVSYQVLTGLEIKSSLGYTNLQTNQININPFLAVAPELRPSSSRFSNFANNNINSWNIEPQITYKRMIGKGAVQVLMGTTFLETNRSGLQLRGVGFNSDMVMKDLSSASSISVLNNIVSEYRYNAIFGRLNYNWENKYIINLTTRRDASSRFGSENLFHNFGSAAAAWLFSNESFVQKELPFLSFGKLRASYGTTGNDQIGDYQFVNLYNPIPVPVAYQGAVGLAPSGLPNPYLQWEETKKLQFGLDLGFLKDHILLNVNYYHNRSSNQLTGYSLPVITGFRSVQINWPAVVQNTGWEFSLNTTNTKSRNFTWNTSVNLTIPKNKLIDFPNIANSSAAFSYAVGQPLTLSKLFHSPGVDPVTGFYVIADSHGKPTSSPDFSKDRTVLINTGQRFYGGVQNNLHYKGFGLSFLLQFVKQTSTATYAMGNQTGRFASDIYGSLLANQPISVLARWKSPGDLTSIQKFSTQFSLPFIYAAYFSDLAVTDASYIRLRNLSFSWELPEKLMQNAHLQNSRFYIQGQNLLTITHFKGMDPESQSVGSIPPLKVWTLGFQVGL